MIHFNRIFHYKPSILGYPVSLFLETPIYFCSPCFVIWCHLFQSKGPWHLRESVEFKTFIFGNLDVKVRSAYFGLDSHFSCTAFSLKQLLNGWWQMELFERDDVFVEFWDLFSLGRFFLLVPSKNQGGFKHFFMFNPISRNTSHFDSYLFADRWLNQIEKGWWACWNWMLCCSGSQGSRVMM